jgi:hypothetical protein
MCTTSATVLTVDWLGGRDSNPDNVVQSHVSYRWTTSQYEAKLQRTGTPNHSESSPAPASHRQATPSNITPPDEDFGGPAMRDPCAGRTVPLLGCGPRARPPEGVLPRRNWSGHDPEGRGRQMRWYTALYFNSNVGEAGRP